MTRDLRCQPTCSRPGPEEAVDDSWTSRSRSSAWVATSRGPFKGAGVGFQVFGSVPDSHRLHGRYGGVALGRARWLRAARGGGPHRARRHRQVAHGQFNILDNLGDQGYLPPDRLVVALRNDFEPADDVAMGVQWDLGPPER